MPLKPLKNSLFCENFIILFPEFDESLMALNTNVDKKFFFALLFVTLNNNRSWNLTKGN